MPDVRKRSIVAVILTALGMAATLVSAQEPADRVSSAESLELFEKQIRPLLLERCAQCHGAETQEGGLRVDHPGSLMEGGDSGNTVVRGDPEKSLLWKAVEYRDESLQMPPPPEAKLSAAQIQAIAAWIKSGAAVPEETGAPRPLKKIDDEEIAKGREFWAFRPVASQLPPAIHDAPWAQNPLDQFIRARGEQQGLTPAAAASKRDLIRRVTFDLTGLPPTPAEVAAYVADETPEAYDRLLDRLLASPRYGERWGRHWLDIARYADSNGLDENVAYGNAWRYRDYVVGALNRDLPYDAFLREQIAGDLLPDESSPATSSEPAVLTDSQRARRIATGFLALGAKVLAEVDEKKMEMDIVDEQIDALGKAVLGMTFGCARCHDHKFDPVSTADYYAMAGIFKSTRTMEHFKKVARWHENSLATAEELARKAEHEARLAQQKASIEQLVEEAKEQVRLTLKPGQTLPQNAEPRFPQETKDRLKTLRDELKALEKNAPEISSAMGVAEGSLENVAIHVRGSHLSLGKSVSRGVPRVIGPDFAAPADRSGRLELANWLVSSQNPLTSRVIVNRLWRWHFGRGLVASVDNFGRLGERPSHPELLDWLAQRFMTVDGWSLKNAHRLMMLSATYQQSVIGSPQSLAADPDNLWYARANLRRLDAEEIRDALLAVSGLLDESMGGSLLHVKNREYLFDHTSLDKTKYDSRRRSIYLPVVRNNLYDVFVLFDYTDAAVSTGSRDATTIAPQALFMLNSQLVIEASTSLAREVLANASTNEDRIRALYERAFGRLASEDEVRTASAYVEQLAGAALTGAGPSEPTQAVEAGWNWLCQAILGTNEFLYVR